MTATSNGRQRLRDLLPNFKFVGSNWQPGPLNSLSDVPGVLVHTKEIISKDQAVKTGVTCILPDKDWFRSACYAADFSFNGAGELTGSHRIRETGLLHSPIVLTNSYSVGAAYQGVYEYVIGRCASPDKPVDWLLLPVGGHGHNGSGDIFLAFSTANPIPVQTASTVDPFKPAPNATAAADDATMNALFEAVADATGESILNALCMAETVTGHLGHTEQALPLDKVKGIVEQYEALQASLSSNREAMYITKDPRRNEKSQ